MLADTTIAWGLVAAALAIAGAAIGTGMAEASIGSAAIGMVTEKPDMSGLAILYLVIPETILIFGFVIAILILLGTGII